MTLDLWGGVGVAVGVAVAAASLYAVVIVATRLNGLRSLAQFSAFDFVMTVSIGTTVATTALSPSVAVVDGVAVVVVLFGLQSTISLLRRRVRLQRLVDNQPLVLMVGDQLVEASLGEARMTAGDVFAKLREEGVRQLDEVAVVVLERTGSISVVRRGQDGSRAVAPALLSEVRRGELVPPG